MSTPKCWCRCCYNFPWAGTEEQAIAKELLAGWDYQNDMDSAPAALFEVFWKHLVIRTFGDDLPELYPPDNGGDWREAVRQLVKTPDDPAVGRPDHHRDRAPG